MTLRVFGFDIVRQPNPSDHTANVVKEKILHVRRRNFQLTSLNILVL